MRCATLTNTPMNAINPEMGVSEDLASLGAAVPCQTDHAADHSDRAIHNMVGMAESTIEVDSTMPISSASPNSASLAASSSSCAIAHAMESVRSPPSAESASVTVGAMPMLCSLAADDIDVHCAARAIPARHHELKRSAREGFTVGRVGHSKPLHLRKLVLSTKTQRRMSVAKSGVRKKRLSAADTQLVPTIGVIFGSTLKSILEFSGVSPTKRANIEAMRRLVRFFVSSRDALPQIHGADHEHLLNGLGVHKVASYQRGLLPECIEPQHARSYLGRSGYKDVAFGATAALLVAHYLMSESGADAQGVADGLQRCATEVDRQLAQWPLSDSMHHFKWHKSSLDAEIRALSRVRAAAIVAADVANVHRLTRDEALRMQLERMRMAAWPRGEKCAGDAQASMIARIFRGDRIGAEDAPLAPCPAFSQPLALSGMPAVAWMSTTACARDDSSEDGSHSSSFGSASTVSSISSSVYEEDTAVDDLDDLNPFSICSLLGLP